MRPVNRARVGPKGATTASKREQSVQWDNRSGSGSPTGGTPKTTSAARRPASGPMQKQCTEEPGTMKTPGTNSMGAITGTGSQVTSIEPPGSPRGPRRARLEIPRRCSFGSERGSAGREAVDVCCHRLPLATPLPPRICFPSHVFFRLSVTHSLRCCVAQLHTRGGRGSRSPGLLPLVIQECREIRGGNPKAIRGDKRAFDRPGGIPGECDSWSGFTGYYTEWLEYVSPQVSLQPPRIPYKHPVTV